MMPRARPLARARGARTPAAAAPAALSALLVVAGPALLALLASEAPSVRYDVALACGAFVSLAGLALARGYRIARLFAALGLGLGLWGARAVLLTAPDFTLLFGVAAAAISSALWQIELAANRVSLRLTLTTPGAVRSGGACACALWAALAIGESADPVTVRVAMAASFALPSAFLLGWAFRMWRQQLRTALVPVASLGVGGALAAALGAVGAPSALTAWVAGLALALPFVQSGSDTASAWGLVVDRPARLVVATFAALCVFGTLLLALPASSTTGHSLGLLDAAFTAVSAACVTGLVVADTGTAFTAFGQATLLGLIQVGGLGMMTFYTLALRAMGRRLGLRHELAVAEVSLLGSQTSLYRTLGVVLALTLVSESCGALALSAYFKLHGLGWGAALWRGTFTAVSAFCNAGFALEAQSLMAYEAEPAVLGVVAVLIVLGGLAPPVVLSLPALLRRRVVPLQVQLVWVMTLLLLSAGFVAYLAFEWSHSLAHLPWWHKLPNAAFQSVTLRTAGFNSLDLSATHPATQVLMIAMMFVGGSPGGTAGGIKTTTVAVLLLAVVAALQGKADVTAFGRRVVHAAVYRAAAVATVGVLSAIAGVVALMLTQTLPPEMAVFEAVSALGTVGLSTGGTVLLDGIGKVIIMLLMFIGRVGPLTLFLLLGERDEGARFHFPDAEVDVG